MTVKNLSLFSDVKHYIKLSRDLQAHLSKYPNDWLRFQEMFNTTLDNLYSNIIQFEMNNINKFESEIYRGKKIFEKRYRSYFLYGEFITWSYKKPYGYAGDFQIIDNIYKNQPNSVGFERLWDNYFQRLAATRAIRERKEDFKKIIFDFVKEHCNRDIRIMNLASGSAREIKELLDNNSDKIFSKVIFDCYDFDVRAIDYARQLLNNRPNINFIQKNAIRMALKKGITKEILQKYDLIYSTGLFDYLDERITVRLIANLRELMKRKGIILISNAAEKYNNSSAGWMEWVADWYLIYRSENEFKKIFLDAGFPRENLEVTLQQGKVMQYCFAKNN